MTGEDMGFIMNYRGDQSTSSQAGKFISYLIVAVEDKEFVHEPLEFGACM